MAEIRPFRALRFAPSLDLASLICPPFDTISPQLQRDLHERSPHNIARLELGIEQPDDNADNNRQQRAAAALRKWQVEEILRRDSVPSFYIYDQEFRYGPRTYSRRSIFARLRLEHWETGVVLPHERTFARPKEDRIRLLRACRCNTSPVFLLYNDDGTISQLLKSAKSDPLFDFQEDGQHHQMRAITDPEDRWEIVKAFKPHRLYVADGHHRYETAIAYRDERRAAGITDANDGFVMVALTASGDSGLLVLPMHRLVKSSVSLDAAMRRLLGLFEVETASSLEVLTEELAQRGRYTTTIGLIAQESPDLYILTLVDQEAAVGLMPMEVREAWRTLDTAIVRHAVVDQALGVKDDETHDDRPVNHCEDARSALDQVRKGHYQFAILVSPVPPDQVLAVADAGQTMPPKSTFFYPKMPTGLLLNPLDS